MRETSALPPVRSGRSCPWTSPLALPGASTSPRESVRHARRRGGNGAGMQTGRPEAAPCCTLRRPAQEPADRSYHFSLVGQPPLPAVVHVRVTTPPSLLIVKVLPLLFPAVAVTV